MSTTEETPDQPAAPQTIEDMLSALPSDQKDAVLSQLTKARQEAAGYRTKLRDAEPFVKRAQELEDAQKSEQERAREAFEAAEKRATTYRDRAVGAEVRALASKSFADPADALAFLDPSKYIDESGDISAELIASDLADLLTRKPHLAASDAPVEPAKKTPAADPSQGSSASGATALSPADAFADWWTATTNR